MNDLQTNLCETCGLRLHVPKRVNTWGQLEEYFNNKLTRKPTRLRDIIRAKIRKHFK